MTRSTAPCLFAFLVALLGSVQASAADTPSPGLLSESATQAPLYASVIAEEISRTRPLVNYCRQIPETGAALQEANTQYVQTLRSVLVDYFASTKLDPERKVPSNTRAHVESIADSCLQDARRYEPVGYCKALLDSFQRARPERIRERVVAYVEIIDAFTRAGSFSPATGERSNVDVRVCGPARIDTGALPLR